MQTIAENIIVTLAGTRYLCDLRVGVYMTQRPALLLFDRASSSSSEVIATVTTSPHPEYLYNMPDEVFASNLWAEEIGLLEQLIRLSNPDGSPLFHPYTDALGQQYLITLRHSRAWLYRLAGAAATVFLAELSDFRHSLSPAVPSTF